MSSTDTFTELEWIKFLGIEPVSAADGRAVIRLQPKPVHLNHNGTVNAPILYALAEVAGAGALVAGMLDRAADRYIVIKRASIEYQAPGRGVMVANGGVPRAVFQRALADVEAGQPCEVETDVTICAEGGKAVAAARFTVSIRPRKDKGPTT